MAVEMEKIEFKDNQEPAISGENLNKMQDNMEKALQEVEENAGSGDGILTGSVIGWEEDTIPEGYEEVKKGYSTEEILTGETWIDGKPIYRKVFDIGALPNAATQDYDTDISVNYNIVDIKGITYGNEWSFYLLPFAHSNSASDNIALYVKKYEEASENWSIRIATGVDRSSLSGLVTIEYTK